MIVLDNSVLVDGLTGAKRSDAAMQRVVELGEPFATPALVLYEWLRGPRLTAELEALNQLIPSERILPFGVVEANVAAELFLSLGRRRPRMFDLAIAACAIVNQAPLWTLNSRDFDDIPGLRLYRLP